MDPNNDDDTLAQLNAAIPIPEDHVEFRVNPDMSWPEELEGENSSTAWGVRQAFYAARDAFVSYRANRSNNSSNKHLTSEGALAADAEWAAQKLPELEKQAQKLRDQAERLEDQLKTMTERALAAPEDTGDGIKPSDVRQWLMMIPERERADRALSLIRKGDQLVLRTVLCTPSWMTGIPPEELEYLREDVIQKSDPERYRRIRAVQKGIVAAERALQSVRKFLTEDTGPDGLRRRAAAYRGPGLRRAS
jgi:hypothetical protein